MWYATRAGTQRPTAANSTRPTVTIAQNAVSASDAWVAVDARGRSSCPAGTSCRSWSRRSRTARRTRRTARTAAGCPRGPSRPRRSVRRRRRAAAAAAHDAASSTVEQERGQDGQPPPETEAHEHGDEHRRQGGAEPEQGVEHQHRAVGACPGWNAATNVFSTGTVSPKPAPRKPWPAAAAGTRPRGRSRSRSSLTRTTIDDDVGAQPRSSTRLELIASASREPSSEVAMAVTHLRQEHRAVLRAGQPVPCRARSGSSWPRGM